MEDKKLTILVATGGFLPGKKYMGITTSRLNFIRGMEEQCHVPVLTVNHDYRESAPYEGIAPGWNTVEGMRACYLPEKEISCQRVEQILREERVDVIYASGTITSFFSFNRPIFAAARRMRCPVIITPDGDIAPSAVHDGFVKAMGAIVLCRALGAFRGAYFQTTGQGETLGLRRYLGIPEARIWNLPFFMHPFLGKTSGRQKEAGKVRAIFCARITPIKNLAFLLEAIKRTTQRLELDIYGTIEDEAYWNSCQKVIASIQRENITVTYRGALNPEEAGTIYMGYDCMLLPTLGENYCFAIEEALTCACPVIISRGTTPWDDVEGTAGYTVPLGDLDGFAGAVDAIGKMDENEYEALLESLESYIKKRENRAHLRQRYLEMFQAVIRASGRGK